MCGVLTIIPACLPCFLDPHFQTSKLLLSGVLYLCRYTERPHHFIQHDLHVRDLLGDLVIVVNQSVSKPAASRKRHPLRLAQLLCQLCHFFYCNRNLQIIAKCS